MNRTGRRKMIPDENESVWSREEHLKNGMWAKKKIPSSPILIYLKCHFSKNYIN